MRLVPARACTWLVALAFRPECAALSPVAPLPPRSEKFPWQNGVNLRPQGPPARAKIREAEEQLRAREAALKAVAAHKQRRHGGVSGGGVGGVTGCGRGGVVTYGMVAWWHGDMVAWWHGGMVAVHACLAGTWSPGGRLVPLVVAGCGVYIPFPLRVNTLRILHVAHSTRDRLRAKSESL